MIRRPRISRPRKPIQAPVSLIAAAVLVSAAMALIQQAAAPNANEQPAAQAQPAGEAAAPGAPAGATDGEEPKETSFLGLLLKGGWFMIPIALASLLGLALIFERLIALRRGAVIPNGFLPGLEGVFRNPQTDAEAALDYCHRSKSPIARVIAVGIRNLPRGVESIEQGIEDAGANEVAKLRRNLRMLYGVSAVAPMLGLLGTVWGLIEAFRQAEQKGFGQPEHFAGGIYEALVTTFAGMCVAIPVLIFYYYFRGKIDRLVSEMNDASERFVEKFLPPHDSAQAATPAQPTRPASTAPPLPQQQQPAAPATATAIPTG